MPIDHDEKALRLVWLAQVAATSNVLDATFRSCFIADDVELFVYLMTVAGVVCGVFHAELRDDTQDFIAFAEATRVTLSAWDSSGFQPFGEGGALIACGTLVESINKSSHELPDFCRAAYWVAGNLKQATPSEEYEKAVNAISAYLKVAFTQWWDNELSLWLTFCPDEPDIFRSGSARAQNKIAEDGDFENKERSVQDQRKDMASTLQSIHVNSTHRKAKELLAKCLEDGESFAFFLRNFEMEASERIVARENPEATFLEDTPQVLLTVINFEGPDSRIADALSGRLPIVGIANPTDMNFRRQIPKLEVSGEDWYQVMQMIAERARIVVMLVSNLSSGILTELTALAKLHRKDSTVILVQDEEVNWIVNFARHAAEEDTFELPDWNSISSRLAEYGTVIRVSEIDGRLGEIIDGMLER